MADERMAADMPQQRNNTAYGLAALEVGLLFLLLITPTLLEFSEELTLLSMAAISVAYMIWAPVAAYRSKRHDLPAKMHTALFSVAQAFCSLAFVGGFALLGSAVLLGLAYNPENLVRAGWDVANVGISEFTRYYAISGMAAIAASAAIFLATMPLLRGDGETAGAFYRRVSSEGFAPLRTVTMATFLLGICLVGVISAIASRIGLYLVIHEASMGRESAAWIILTEFPGFAVSLAGTAVALAAFRRIQPAGLASLRAAATELAKRAPGSLAALAGTTSVFGWYAYSLHLGMVGALGAVSMIVPWNYASDAASDWLAAQREAGRAPAEIAADLRAHGNWSPTDPESGLGELFPGFANRMKETNLADRCTVTLDAGTADNAALRSLDWVREFETDVNPLSEVSYCLRIACPSPVSWSDNQALILTSSHPSQNSFWMYNQSLDLFAEGRTRAPGGYCNADGTLADEFQG